MSVQLNLIAPADNATIKSEIKKLREQMDALKADMEIISVGIKHYQKMCKHKGQRTGMNERDGSWGAPCPTCGYSY